MKLLKFGQYYFTHYEADDFEGKAQSQVFLPTDWAEEPIQLLSSSEEAFDFELNNTGCEIFTFHEATHEEHGHTLMIAFRPDFDEEGGNVSLKVDGYEAHFSWLHIGDGKFEFQDLLEHKMRATRSRIIEEIISDSEREEIEQSEAYFQDLTERWGIFDEYKKKHKASYQALKDSYLGVCESAEGLGEEAVNKALSEINERILQEVKKMYSGSDTDRISNLHTILALDLEESVEED